MGSPSKEIEAQRPNSGLTISPKNGLKSVQRALTLVFILDVGLTSYRETELKGIISTGVYTMLGLPWCLLKTYFPTILLYTKISDFAARKLLRRFRITALPRIIFCSPFRDLENFRR